MRNAVISFPQVGKIEMAIYHCSTKTISRSSGRSSVAASAYRAGERLEDERTGLVHDFTRKDGVMYTTIISNVDIPLSRRQLWNLAEQVENRKDARTAREWVVALPEELNDDQRRDLAKVFAKSLVDRYGVIADLAIHAPSEKGDQRNYHAHILLTTRKASVDEYNQLVLGEKSDIELSNAKRATLGLAKTQDDIKEIRQMWADQANKALVHAMFRETFDHRSYADQNSDFLPTVHEGTKVTQLRRQGIDTEISRQNDQIKYDNLKITLNNRYGSYLEQSSKNVQQKFDQWKEQKELQEKQRIEQEQKQQELGRSNSPNRGFSR